MDFTKDSLSIFLGDHTISEPMKVVTVKGDTFSTTGEHSGTVTNWVYGIVGNLKYTTVRGFSSYGNSTYPDSFAQGVRSNDTINYLMWQCNKWGGKDTCDFEDKEQASIFDLILDTPTKMLGRVGDDPKCGRCDAATEKCEECACGTGDDCVPHDECVDKCEPKGPKYRCDWKETPPKCVQDDEGTQSQQLCEHDCKPAQYGKCDFENDTCVECTPGAGEKDCVNLMSYCQIARDEGRCKEQVLNGLYRSVESNLGYESGEFDVEFRDSKMFIQDGQRKELKTSGDVRKTGTAEKGGVQFVVENLSHPIWPDADTIYGIYEETFGEQQVFKFLELGLSNVEITHLS